MRRLICYFVAAMTVFYMDLLQAEKKLRPIPWVTDKAVSFLTDYMEKNPDARVLEFGSGASTVWFSKRTENLVSVEHDKYWYDRVRNILEEDDCCNPVNYILKRQQYYNVCNDFPDEFFDLILVDGKHRFKCINRSIRVLKKGGILMIDNAEMKGIKMGLKLLKEWKGVKTRQKGKDSVGFTYPRWETHWYIKP